MVIRTLAAAALAAAAYAPAATAATAATDARCEFGPQLGTLCVHHPVKVANNVACPILEGQTLFGIKCA